MNLLLMERIRDEKNKIKSYIHWVNTGREFKNYKSN